MAERSRKEKKGDPEGEQENERGPCGAMGGTCCPLSSALRGKRDRQPAKDMVGGGGQRDGERMIKRRTESVLMVIKSKTERIS